MSDLLAPNDCLYFFSVIYKQNDWEIEQVISLINERINCPHRYYPEFNPSLDYYSKEMGASDSLVRVLLFNFTAASKEDFIEHKIWADQVEKKYMNNHQQRSLNIDVGLLAQEQMLLATGKPYSHRVYLGKGVYADLNYIFANKSYQSLAWTYPDYAHPEKVKFFNWLRQGLF